MTRIKKTYLALLVAFLSSTAANADYMVIYSYSLLPLTSPDRVSESVQITNDITSVDVTESASDATSSSTATIRANLADGSIRLATVADNSATTAFGGLRDVITFNLNGDDPFDLTYSITINGTATCPTCAQASLQARFTGSNDVGINQGATNAVSIWGTTYTSTFTIIDGWSYNFSMGYNLGIVGTASADSLNSALFSWNLPDAYSYTSSSGVFLQGIREVPEPGTLALLGLGLVGMAARRRKTV